MMRVRVQTKLVLLVGVVLGLFLAGIFLMHTFGQEQARLLTQDKAKEKAQTVSMLVELQGSSLTSFVYDYSFWDEMMTFVGTGDSAWGYDNIVMGMDTYHADMALVLDTTGRRVYGATRDEEDASWFNSSMDSLVAGAFGQSQFAHFFLPTEAGIVEIRTAPIQPSADNQRVTPASGIFAAGRIWDEDYLIGLEQKCRANLTLAGTSHEFSGAEPTGAREDGTYVLWQPLPGPDGEPTDYLVCEAGNPLYTAFQRAERGRLVYLSVFCLLIMAILIVAVRIWISRPLQRVMESLATGDTNEIGELGSAGEEFDRLSELLSDFFRQNRTLEAEIGERRLAEDAVRDRERLLNATLESTADGILVASGDGRATHFNAKFLDMWGIPDDVAKSGDDDRIIGCALSQVDNPSAFVARIMDVYGSDGESFDTIELKDGRMVERYSSRLTYEGKEGGRVWCFRDVTERHKAEAARRELQESLERAQRMESLGLLAGGVAHDLNNILGPIVGYSELLEREVNHDPKLSGRVQKITRSAEEAAAVIQDLLTLARRGRYEMQSANINEVVASYSESVGFERLRKRHPDVGVDFHLSKRVEPILGSPVHLGKVVMNLVTNACEAMAGGGSLQIRTECAHLKRLLSGVGDIEENDYVMLRVRDTGTGIAPEDIKNIFEPYFSRKKMGCSGSGLGLSIVYGIVQDHHGHCDVFSEPGKGTEFVLYFPVCRTAMPAASQTQAAVTGGTERVLVVDDRSDQLEMAVEILTGLGYRVVTAASGGEAVALLERDTFDIVVLDMIMEPGIDGLDTYREILRRRPGQKAIVVSGYSESDRTQSTLDLGAGACVRKPYRMEMLAGAIRAELDKAPQEQAQLVAADS